MQPWCEEGVNDCSPLRATTLADSAAPVAHWLPWAHFNLRRNPFGELTSQERVALAVVDVAAVAQRLSGPRSAVQWIGDCGRGKTTRMLALASRFPAASYVYLPEDRPCPPIAAGSPLLIDEAQRMPLAAWRLITATGLPLVLATHRDLGRRLKRFGYTVSTERIGDGNTPELVCELLNRRIEGSRLHSGPLPTVSLAEARGLVQRFGSDIRGIEHHLYERVQTQVNQHGKMRFVD